MTKVEQISPRPDFSRGVSILLSLAGGLLGFALAVALLTGDASGQVNLLLLLLYFALLPALTLLLSLGVLALKRPGAASFLLEIPIWPKRLLEEQARLGLLGLRQHWLFYLSQLFALFFSLGSVFGFIVMLLGTDLYFVWRSTLLDAGNLLPVLEWLSLPWRFFEAGQPDMQLLNESRDIRLADAAVSASSSSWWQFILAAQLCYGLLPRIALTAYAAARLRRAARPRSSSKHDAAASNQVPNPAPAALAEKIESLGAIDSCFYWGDIPAPLLSSLQSRLPQLPVAKSLKATDTQFAGHNGDRLLLVKSWEPPLGELADTLLALQQQDKGSLLILGLLNWSKDQLLNSEATHEREWRRFAATLPDCVVCDMAEQS